MMLRSFFILLFINISLLTSAQDDQWWNEIHGRTPDMPQWKYFMVVSPGYLGINALPVPSQLKGLIPEKPELEFTTDFHVLPGEKAQNLYFRYLHPFAEGRVAVEIFGYPIEHYKHDEIIRDERKSRNKSGEGWEIGDLYFATHIRLLQQPKLPSIVLRMAAKTASGNLTGARFSDSPGYWFDLSAGQTFKTGNVQIRAFAMAGFYCWQTTSDRWLQNDALLWGGGVEATYRHLSIEQSLQGYSGWRDERDRPVNYRLIGLFHQPGYSLKIEYQHGLRDVLYRTFKIGYIFRF